MRESKSGSESTSKRESKRESKTKSESKMAFTGHMVKAVQKGRS